MKISLKRPVLLATIVFSCVGCDQATKAIARGCLKAEPAISFFGDSFRLQYAENQGAFLGLGANLPDHWRTGPLIVVASAWLVLLAVLLLSREWTPARFVALALILAGGLGNLIDRISNHNAVVDFMNLGVGRVRTGIFNVADVALICGAAMLLFVSVERRDASAHVRD
jgi:signal peptidase II